MDWTPQKFKDLVLSSLPNRQLGRYFTPEESLKTLKDIRLSILRSDFDEEEENFLIEKIMMNIEYINKLYITKRGLQMPQDKELISSDYIVFNEFKPNFIKIKRDK